MCESMEDLLGVCYLEVILVSREMFFLWDKICGSLIYIFRHLKLSECTGHRLTRTRNRLSVTIIVTPSRSCTDLNYLIKESVA